MNIHPRDYQGDAKSSVMREWESVVSTLVVMPTGLGKTIVFAEIIEAMQPKRALVLAHREELIWQARQRIHDATGLECDIEMADLRVSPSLFSNTPVVISTVQTQNAEWNQHKRMGKFKPQDFGLLIIDEAHHATAKSYKDVIHYYRQNPDLRVLGVTATPDRADEEALGQVFDSVAFDYEILDAIHGGWLVPIEQQFVTINGLDFSQVRTTAGDLNGADLAEVMEAEKNMQGVASATVEIVGDRRTIVFTASVKQAEVISNIFNRHKPGMSDWVCGATNKDKRREILERFKTGDVQVVCNCNVLTEGFDNPAVEVVVMARPTKSRSLYAQMAGRSMRPLPGVVDNLPDSSTRRDYIRTSGKPSCLIVDFVGNSGRHKLMSSADILGGKVSEAAVERALAAAQKAGAPVRMDELLDDSEDELRAEADARRKLEEARKAKLVAKVKFSAKRINPFDAFEIQPVNSRGWDQGKHLSEKQIGLLLRQGIDPTDMPFAQAKQVINELFRRWDGKLCSLKQANVLKRYGYETHDLTREQASKLLDALARNQWRKPVEPPKQQVPF